ncbi:GDSL esterase/lipase 7-like [Spinacia oleracea]|uniref:GDSL esterase/lipase 7-like n=1 Tax=Spinacia oleracea TaxID=3562 RepID=A0A9R0KD92_SPIOL|nr:GDSL esterase/lipase 7-like [Spinacia oleracea]
MLPPTLLHHIILIFLHFLTLLSTNASSPQKIKSTSLAPALFVFGDSLVDNGNNNLLPTIARANYSPYGLDFPTKVLPGRFTNGRTPADFIAEYLELPYPPPYASLYRPNLLTGYNYASGASGILPETGSLFGKCFNLDEQIGMFQSTIESQLGPYFKEQKQLKQHLSKSIYFLSVGNNDYLNNYLHPLYLESKVYDPPHFAHFLIDELSLRLQRLYGLGARKFLVSEVGPIGCIPIFARGVTTNLNHKHGTKCDDGANNILLLFNKQLIEMIKILETTLQDSHFILLQTYSFSYDAIMNPAKYGLSDSSNPCCKTWLNGTSSCIPEEAPCQNPNNHYFWDGYHPTELVYSRLSAQCIHGSSLCVPLNLSHLVQL